ncbi:MAG: hypothetical protein KJO19_03675 [Woeseia sp.]|nr:hypothetical protein [Woeseia sp.]
MQREQTKQWINIFAVVSVALTVLFFEDTKADELDAATSYTIDTEIIDELLEYSVAGSAIDADLDPINLPEPEAAWIAFAKDCASLDAIPLFELKNERDRRVFVGINFDGVFGIHGLL